jgi:3-methyl-2-oxobutanoate hydroxymethyltransferase
MSKASERKKTTVQTFINKKVKGEKITVLTAYDYYMAKLLDQAGIDAILVGDSAANVVHGFDSTLPITMDVMVAHTAAVARGTEKALVIADMPFLSFQPSTAIAIANAGRFLKEGRAKAVKMEGGIEMAATVKRVVECGIPVMGHIGLTPQSIHRWGGPKVQGREEKSRAYLMESALALEEAGCFAMVLELINADTAGKITAALKTAATIGIGAGEEGFAPKFLRQYADLPPIIAEAVKKYIDDVRLGDYPGEEESFYNK